MIGIFWVYNSKIYFTSVEKENIKAINGFKDSDFAHYQVWNEISSQNKDFYLYEYEDIPRGRVVYDVENQQYVVYANNDIISSNEANLLVINAFNLKGEKVLFKYDEHYEIMISVVF